MDSEDVFFEIKGGGDFITVIAQKFSYQNSDDSWDRRWITAEVRIKAGAFSGRYGAQFMNVDFSAFKKELEYLYEHLDSSALFEDLDQYLKIKIKGDGLGHLEVFCKATDNPGYLENRLAFYITTDQTYIPQLIRQLERINKEFPAFND